MVSKKSILWTLALLVIVAISTTAILQYREHRQERKKAAAALAQAKKDKHKREKEKAKSDSDEEPADEPKPAPKAEPKATVLSPAAKQHLAEQSFISDLRTVLLWRSTQPENPETSRVLLEKLSAIACEDLPPDRKSAWLSLLQDWKSLSDPTKAMAIDTDPQLKAQTQQAAATLNAMFQAHGDGDIVL